MPREWGRRVRPLALPPGHDSETHASRGGRARPPALPSSYVPEEASTSDESNETNRPRAGAGLAGAARMSQK
eukprot:3753312-Pyramimonas_sp.AAC.1